MIKIKNIISNVVNYIEIKKSVVKILLALKEELKENSIKNGLTISLDYSNVRNDEKYSSNIYPTTHRWVEISKSGLRVSIFSTWKLDEETPFFIDINLSEEEKREIFKKSEVYDDYFNIMDQADKKIYFSRYWKID